MTTDPDLPGSRDLGCRQPARARLLRHARSGDLDRVIQEAIDFCLGGLLGAQTMTVADLRADVDMTPELERVRDKVGASANGAARAG